jgi:protein-S-isoprenylcysteine O-methyltransferase Ste14
MTDLVAAQAAQSQLEGLQRRRKRVILAATLFLVATIPFIQAWGKPEGGVPETVETVGRSLILLAILGRAWATLYIGGRKTIRLATGGPYSISRNPLYLFSFLGAAGLGAQTGSMTSAALFAIGTVLIFFSVIKREEAALQIIFGQAYEDYCRRTPRFGPRLSAWRDAATIEISPTRLYRTIGDGLIFLAIVPLFELIDWAQGEGYLGVLFQLP